MATSASISTPPAIGRSLRPNGPLSVFDGDDVHGTWTLNVSDRAFGDTGTVVQWCLVPNSGSGPTRR